MKPSRIGCDPGLLSPTAFGRLKQEDGEFKANMGYVVTLSLCTNKEGRQGMLANTESEKKYLSPRKQENTSHGAKSQCIQRPNPAYLGFSKREKTGRGFRCPSSEKWRRDRERTLLSRRDPSGHS